MKISKLKKRALETIIRNKSIIGYTAEYIIIISVTEIIYRYIAFWALNNIFGIPDAVKIIFKAILDLLNAQFLTTYIYMLIRGKMKFKRFFSFFHKKHLSYYLLTSAVIIPYRIIDLLFDKFKETNIPAATVCAAVNLILSAFSFMMIYFKAAYPKERFKENFKRTTDFIAGSIIKIILFCLSFFGWYIAEILLLYIFFVVLDTDTSIIAEGTVFLTTSRCGLGLILFPYFILSCHYMAEEFK